jgi:hypothetical protein
MSASSTSLSAADESAIPAGLFLIVLFYIHIKLYDSIFYLNILYSVMFYDIATPNPTPLKIAPGASTAKTFKKILPLGAMLFFILFNYTILRDTKDVLVVTAPNSGAEIIPFLKTYVNLPSAIGFTILYSSLSNRFSADKVR